MGRAACLAVAIALSACGHKPPVIFGERMPAGCTKKTTSERCVGWLFDHLLMAIAFRPYDDPQIHAYVASIGARLAAATHDHRRWTFRVLDDDQPQAYSGFNSTIYITRGALAVLRDEAELASVIGHEMGHTIAGHNRETLQDFAREETVETEIQEWRDLRYARDDEIQADELAVVYLGRAGYDIHAVERMLRAIGAGDDDEDASDDRHPVFRERIARAAALAAHFHGGDRGIERYNAAVAKLVVGEDPRAIALVDHAAVFARAKLAVDLPVDTQTTVFRNMVFVAWTRGGAGTIQIIDKRLATEIKNDDRSYTEVKVIGDVALAVTVVIDDGYKAVARGLAKSLLATARSPRADELARLHAKLFDPTMPRPIWAN